MVFYCLVHLFFQLIVVIHTRTFFVFLDTCLVLRLHLIIVVLALFIASRYFLIILFQAPITYIRTCLVGERYWKAESCLSVSSCHTLSSNYDIF